jgi:hypothetical protein
MSDTPPGASTHGDLWAGIDLKIENANFHFDGMKKALQPPERPPELNCPSTTHNEK